MRSNAAADAASIQILPILQLRVYCGRGLPPVIFNYQSYTPSRYGPALTFGGGRLRWALMDALTRTATRTPHPSLGRGRLSFW